MGVHRLLYILFIICGGSVFFLFQFNDKATTFLGERYETSVLRFSVEQKKSSGHNCTELKRPKIILSWTDYFGVRTAPNFLFDCPDLTYRCVVHSQRDRLAEADAVLFHTKDIRPDIERILSLPRIPQQYFVYYSLEAPPNAQIKPGGMPENFFNWTATFLPSSDIQYTYMAKGWVKREDAEKKGISFKTTVLPLSVINKERKRAIFGAISNCHTSVKRSEFIAKVAKYINGTLIAGFCSLNEEGKELCSRGKSDAADCFRSHSEDSYFTFALENSICDGYITEKYWERIHMNTVLILWTRSVFNKIEIPPKSAIFVDDYKSIRELTDHLKYLMTNQTAYAEYFEWRKDYTPDLTESLECGVCRKLLNEDGKTMDEKTKMYSDALSWFHQSSHCQKPLNTRMKW